MLQYAVNTYILYSTCYSTQLTPTNNIQHVAELCFSLIILFNELFNTNINSLIKKLSSDFGPYNNVLKDWPDFYFYLKNWGIMFF